MAKIWERFKKFLAPEASDDSDEILDQNRKKEPNDEKFARLFNMAGGYFFYSADKQEALENLKNIADNQQIGRVICFDSELQTYLNTLGIRYIDYPSASSDFSFITCEALIAFDGSVMLSFDQTGGRKLSELPDNFIVFASPKQILPNSSEALHVLKRKKKDKLPGNITCIRGKEMHNMDDIPNAKNIYLLLVEE